MRFELIPKRPRLRLVLVSKLSVFALLNPPAFSSLEKTKTGREPVGGGRTYCTDNRTTPHIT